jgi:hypothetical protein
MCLGGCHCEEKAQQFRQQITEYVLYTYGYGIKQPIGLVCSVTAQLDQDRYSFNRTVLTKDVSL